MRNILKRCLYSEKRNFLCFLRYIFCSALHWIISESRSSYNYIGCSTPRGEFTFFQLETRKSNKYLIVWYFKVLTKDSVTVSVDAVVYYRVSNATVSVANVENAHHSTRLLAQTTLRNILGTKNLHEILSDRESISGSMQVVGNQVFAWICHWFIYLLQ